MKLDEAAMMIAIDSHAGDRNKHDGEMYLLHVARVVVNVSEMGGDVVQRATAWLHDTIEDTPLTLVTLTGCIESLYDGGADDECKRVVAAVDALTKHKGEDLTSYYQRVKMNPDARFVKYHGDLKDNFRRNHLVKDEATKLRMTEKYSLGMDMLG